MLPCGQIILPHGRIILPQPQGARFRVEMTPAQAFTAVAPVGLGIEARFRALVSRIKQHPNTTPSIGLALGIEGVAQPGAHFRPKLCFEWLGIYPHAANASQTVATRYSTPLPTRRHLLHAKRSFAPKCVTKLEFRHEGL